MMLIICAVVRRLSRRAARLVDLHIFCSTSYTKMFVGKDSFCCGGIFYCMEMGWGTLISSRGVGIFCVGPVFGRAMAWVWVWKTYGTNFDLDLSGPRSKVSNKTIFNLKKYEKIDLHSDGRICACRMSARSRSRGTEQ